MLTADLSLHSGRAVIRLSISPFRIFFLKEKLMLSKRILALCFALACGAVSAAAQNNPFLGKWDITPTSPGGGAYWLEVKNENGQLTGYFLNRGGSVLKLPAIAIEKDELVFSPATGDGSASKVVHRAKV